MHNKSTILRMAGNIAPAVIVSHTTRFGTLPETEFIAKVSVDIALAIVDEIERRGIEA